MGVDIFFVISGYLISGLILKDLDAGRFRLLEFWERRVRRIFPALVVVCLCNCVAGLLMLWPQDFKEFGQSVRAQALAMSNFHFWMKSGYFEPATGVKPLLHTWSLAVEEQFYFFLPVALMALVHFSRRAVIPVIVAIGGTSFGLCVYASYTHPVANFYLLPTRAWELLLGSFLAALPAPRTFSRRRMELMSGSGFLAVGWAIFFYSRGTRFPGVAALLPCAGAAAIIWSNTYATTLVTRLLSIRPLVFIGLISYSLYLWHWPVLAFAKYGTLDGISVVNRVILLVGCGVVAVLSWRFVETPVRKRIVFGSRSRIFVLAGTCTAAFVFCGWMIDAKGGFPSRLPETVRSVEWTTPEQQRQKFSRFDLSVENIRSGTLTELGAGDKEPEPSFLLWGDSHGMAVLPVLDALCRERKVRGVAATHFGRAPLLGFAKIGDVQAALFCEEVVSFVRRNHVRDVFLVAHWKFYVADDPAEARHALLVTVAALKEAGARIWIMKDVPVQRWPVSRGIATIMARGGNPDDAGLLVADHIKVSQQYAPFFERLSGLGVSIVDPAECLVSPAGRCRITKDGVPLYFDDNHLSEKGAMMLQTCLEPIFNRRANGPAVTVP